MATVIDALRAVSGYPVTGAALDVIVLRRGLDGADNITAEILTSDSYRLAEADVMMWLSSAPDVTQGGISYSFTDEERSALKSKASAIYAECEDTSCISGVKYGYKGSRL